jgi:hypothetical protein
MSTKSKRHTHKYYKVLAAGTKVWACALPDCMHYMPKHMEMLVNGKNSICWQCGETFVMNPLNMKEDQPRCNDCRLGIPEMEELTVSEALLQKAEKITGKESDDNIEIHSSDGLSTESARKIAEFLKR